MKPALFTIFFLFPALNAFADQQLTSWFIYARAFFRAARTSLNTCDPVVTP